MRIVRLTDDDEARELHKVAFPYDKWPDPACTSWALRDDALRVFTGYIAAKVDVLNFLFIERIAVVPAATGTAMRLLRQAERWGRKQGCPVASTYIKLKNYPSIFLFKKAGYRFKELADGARYAGEHVHYCWKEL
jgi:GNAT superfamily N-acetyltransferase